MFSKVFLPSWLIASSLPLTAFAQTSLPQVDLGYEIHQAIYFNETGQVYNFSNIRYAQPPVGDLRFSAPVPPTGRNPVVQNGNVGVICPQADPVWLAIAVNFTAAYVQGLPFNFTASVLALEAELASGASAPPDPRTTEDCLFLDVLVPKHIFDNAPNCKNGAGGAAVLVWIYGGGYATGEKTGSGNPSGIIATSQSGGSNGVIFVELNYRLGALGWLAGPTLQSSGGVSNAGLYDQRLALEWVQKYIHLFGGDPNRVTIFGESAGGGSIMHQITAYGGQKPVPFQQAIPQSPGWLPVPSNYVQENTTQNFLALLNVSTIKEAQQLPSETVIAVNALQIASAPYGSYIYGPVVDGIFVPALPPLLLSAGAFAKDLKVMVGHNADEGPIFTDPRLANGSLEAVFLETDFPGINPAVVSYITTTLYPPVYDGSQPYTSAIERAVLIVSELIFTCNTNYLDRAFGNKTYAYEFSVPPATHEWDVDYTFYDGISGSEQVVPQVALALQKYITDFAQGSTPNGAGVPFFPLYGTNSSEENINVTGIMPMQDPTENARCLFWEKSLLY